MTDQPNPKSSAILRLIRTGLTYLLSRCNNPISILGIMAATASLFFLVTFWIYYLTAPVKNNYLEIIGFIVLPGIFVFGLLAIPVGFVNKQRSAKKHGQPISPGIAVDQLVGAIGIFAVLTLFVVLPVFSVSSYYVYTYTETTRFCGEVCHKVMKPQATAHARSAHARVACARCHIGEGAGWFVRSKLSGLRQVYATIANTYSRPIPPAITELRPARETCEECHWPSQFFGYQFKELNHYSEDEFSQNLAVRMTVKTGGSNTIVGRSEGIHNKMLNSGRIEYVAADPDLQEINWVRHEGLDGEVHIYQSKYRKLPNAPIERVRRRIDCMDCHNRGAHHLRSPQTSIDLEIRAGRIDIALPFIKREAAAALVDADPDTPTALLRIKSRINQYYQKEWPAAWQAKQAEIRNAIERIQSIYQQDFFPEMKEDWRTYPENVGHQFSSGCFRCHDGLHTDEHGHIITSDCTVCHLFINPVEGEPDNFTFGRFVHPIPLSVHKNVRCHTCHGSGKRPRCTDCHKDRQWQGLQGKGRFKAINEPAEPPKSNSEFQLIKPKPENEWRGDQLAPVPDAGVKED